VAVSMRELLEAGVHFGHQTRRWNPKMKRFIFSERGGIYIIDLQQTQELLDEACAFARNVAERGGILLFVGTKKQAQDAVEEQAKRVGMPYVNHRWLGGLLTNWRTITDRIQRLHELRQQRDEGQLDLLPPKERIDTVAELDKLESNLGGVADLKKQPDAIFIVDLKKEQLAVREARRLKLPVIALVDTNCDPEEADYVIPGNDDAMRACSLIVRAVADAVEEGRQRVGAREFERAAAEEQQAAAEQQAAEAPAAPDEIPPEYEQLSHGEAAVEPEQPTVADPVLAEGADQTRASEPASGSEAVAEAQPESVVEAQGPAESQPEPSEPEPEEPTPEPEPGAAASEPAREEATS
jgi:small subunit ribosomal protein S2